MGPPRLALGVALCVGAALVFRLNFDGQNLTSNVRSGATPRFSQAFMSRRGALIGSSTAFGSLIMQRPSLAGGLLDFKRNSQSKLWLAGTLLAREKLQKALEFSDNGLYTEALDMVKDASGSCVGDAGVPESKYRCLFNIFERSVMDRAKEYVEGNEDLKKQMGSISRSVLIQQIDDLNQAYVTLVAAADGSSVAQNKAHVAIKAAIDTNINVELAFVKMFGVPPLEKRLPS
ncbi:hypothetical protein AAMO2058_001702100 [Amorphochlora amoebiformis]